MSKGFAAKILPDVERRWLWQDNSTEEGALKLKQSVLSLIKPFMECVPARMPAQHADHVPALPRTQTDQADGARGA